MCVPTCPNTFSYSFFSFVHDLNLPFDITKFCMKMQDLPFGRFEESYGREKDRRKCQFKFFL